MRLDTPLKYKILAHFVAILHLAMIALNLLSIPFAIVNCPFYIWMPIITFMVSPLIGGVYCIFNRLENAFRRKAGMNPIHDRLGSLLEPLIYRRK